MCALCKFIENLQWTASAKSSIRNVWGFSTLVSGCEHLIRRTGKSLHHILHKIKKGTELAIAEMLRTKQGFLTMSTLVKERFQKMHLIVEEETKQLNVIHL
jgi:hypothetical protein